ncbi:unnamed protein product [Symbiodinium natans]|uniref:Uncharacterized protein n=1 Tax=Symbiodinium natans TaxID=878477 RepID=A0A812K8P6_9DINO|nr:unnamed protein product [Symbiodinium natans]
MDYVSYLLHTLGNDDAEAGTQRELACSLLVQCVLIFKTLVVLIGHDSWELAWTDFRHVVEEFIDATSPLSQKSAELMGHIASVLLTDIPNEMTLSIFGMLQWLSTVLNFPKRGGKRRVAQSTRPCLPAKSQAWNHTLKEGKWRILLEELVSCLIKQQLYTRGSISRPLAWVLDLGRRYWAPLHVAMAEAAGTEPYLLPFPSALQPRPPAHRDPRRLPLAELCATGRQQRQLQRSAVGGVPLPTESPMVSDSAYQRDGTRLTVVTVATGLPNSADSERPSSDGLAYLLDFLIYVERPRGECIRRGRCGDKNRTVYTCGPHAAILPEVSLRKWRCLFPTGKERWVDAYAVSFFRQAATIRCPVPSDVSLSLEGPLLVELQADSPYAGAEAWKIAADVCAKLSEGAGAEAPDAVVAEDAADAAARLAICVQPAWDMPDLERSVPRLIETFLRYYQLLGADSFTFYDFDGSFASHPEIVGLLATGKLKYFPRFMKAVSELLEDAWNLKLVKGQTGSRASFIQELTLNHCVLNYRSAADFVLLADKDVFLAFGPSIPVFPQARGCWRDAGTTSTCCSGTGPHARGRVHFHGKTPCWEGSRTFSKCCLEYMPEAPMPSPWPEFLKSRSPEFWRAVGTIALGVCEFAVPSSLNTSQTGSGWSFSSHIWRPKSCESQYYHLVSPWRFMSQNSEWVRLRPGSVRYYVDSEAARAMHLVNLHKVRCTEQRNDYGNGRQPCNWPDFGLRWSLPGLPD